MVFDVLCRRVLRRGCLSCALGGIALSASGLVGQQARKFSNFETPHVQPVAVARLAAAGGADIPVVLVCNSADNSVELYRGDAPFEFLQRVPVGMGPVSVVWNAELGRFYTCNFDGDSVSVVRLEVVSSGAGPRPYGFLERTSFVGDQPSDLAFGATGQLAAVTLSGTSSSVLVDGMTLAVVAPEAVLDALEPSIDVLTVAAKAPRDIEVLPDGRTYVLNFMGSDPEPGANARYEMDLWYLDPTNPPLAGSGVAGRQLGGLGTTNQAITVTSDGNRMVVVGTKARNFAASGEANVAALPFGFVESHMWVVDIPAGVAPSVRPEPVQGVSPVTALPSRNLNKNYSTSSAEPVTAKYAISQPSDVALVEGASGEIEVIAMTAFHSDKVVLLRPDSTVPGGYAEQQILLSELVPQGEYGVVGPSGIEYSADTGLLYVVCRLDATLRVIDPDTGALVSEQRFHNDPTPDYIRRGRRFLYDASYTSGSGFVSCASCHINAATDALPWDLGDPGPNCAIPPQLNGSVNQEVVLTEFPSSKGALVTQTLQGLVNYEVNAEAQYLLTNAPYHWRGDRADFQAFNPAFVGLLQRDEELTEEEMFHYTQFINSVLHPANFEQPLDREVEGSLGDDPDDPLLATGAKLGLQVFHNFPTDGVQGCVGCHSLPDGSDNVLTEGFFRGGEIHPLESAAMRNLRPREQLLHTTFGVDEPLVALANTGLTHSGADAVGGGDFPELSMNFFVHSEIFVYPVNDPLAPLPNRDTFAQAVTEYTRKFDNGTSPAAGRAFTLSDGDAQNVPVLRFLERQVREANIGLAILVRSGPKYSGYYFDVTASASAGSPPMAMYRREGSSQVVSRARLLTLLQEPDTVIIAQATPLGAERRVANRDGIATLLEDQANPPAGIEPEKMVPMSYSTDITKFVGNLRINTSVMPPVVTIAPNTSLWALRTLQLSVLGSYGVDDLHHEPPRRLRVTGDNIRLGAKLLLGIPTTDPGAFPVQVLELDLYPTDRLGTGGRRVWETEEELDALVTFALLNGGPFAPGVVETAWRTTTTPALDPATWNRFGFAVQNEDGTINSVIPFLPLEVADDR